LSNQRKWAKIYELLLGKVEMLLMMWYFCVLRMMMNLKMKAAKCIEILITLYQSTHLSCARRLEPL